MVEYLVCVLSLVVELASYCDHSTGGDVKEGAAANNFKENCSIQSTVPISGVDCEHHISNFLYIPLTTVCLIGLETPHQFNQQPLQLNLLTSTTSIQESVLMFVITGLLSLTSITSTVMVVLVQHGPAPRSQASTTRS